MDWQPIDTAPKDDTPVLLWNGTVSVGSRSWHHEWFGLVNERIAIADDRGDAWTIEPKPTHWMPLPKGP
jgi:hypothetical protein